MCIRDSSRDEKAPKAFLNFEGVDSCFYVWINGSYVGYSQVSHMTSESVSYTHLDVYKRQGMRTGYLFG